MDEEEGQEKVYGSEGRERERYLDRFVALQPRLPGLLSDDDERSMG